MVCSNREARKCPARGHSRNGPWTRRHTHTHVDTKKRNGTKHTSIDTQHESTTPTRNNNYILYLICLNFWLLGFFFNPHSYLAKFSRNAHRWRCSNKDARKRLVEGTPAMDLGHMCTNVKFELELYHTLSVFPRSI